MDIFFLQLVIVFIPGLIWERIDNRFGVNRPTLQFDILRRAFSFGISAYVITAGLFLILAKTFPRHSGFFAFELVALSKDSYSLTPKIIQEIVAASIIALIGGTTWLYITNNKLPVRFMQFIRATKRYGDEDVWDFTFNSKRAEVEYVHVRDFENELTFGGWVEVFSETGKVRELVLRDVIVYNFATGEELYAIPRLYLARSSDKITIEFPYSPHREAKNG